MRNTMKKIILVVACLLGHQSLFANTVTLKGCVDHPDRMALICAYKMQWFVEDCTTTLKGFFSRSGTVVSKAYTTTKGYVEQAFEVTCKVVAYILASPFIVAKEIKYLIYGKS